MQGKCLASCGKCNRAVISDPSEFQISVGNSTQVNTNNNNSSASPSVIIMFGVVCACVFIVVVIAVAFFCVKKSHKTSGTAVREILDFR